MRFLLPMLWMACVLQAGPIVIFDDFGPANSYLPGPGIAVGCGANCFQDAGHSSAWSFVPGQTARLSTLETIAWAMFGAPVTLVVSIYSSDASLLPGAILETWSVPLGPAPQLLISNSATHSTLQAGGRYWFTATTADPINQAAMVGINSVGVTGPEAFRIGSGAWIPSGSTAYSVFRVTADAAVPEPATVVSLALGLMMLGCWRRIGR